ncbi:MAG: tyrosine-type recombinase/integrase [Nocardioides sp.]
MSTGRGPSGVIKERHGKHYPVVRFYQDGKRRERWLTGHKTKTAARKALRDALHSQDHGTWQPSAEPMTYGEYLTQRWLPSLTNQVRETTLAGYARHVRVYLVPQLGDLRLDRLTGADLAAFYGRLRLEGVKGKPLAENTVARIHATVSRSLGDAVEARLRSTNPARDLPRNARPKQGRSGGLELRYWTADQLGTFLELARTTEPRFYPLVRLAAFTGMRRGEVVGLRWQDVDLEAAHLAVRHTITAIDDPAQGGMKLVHGEPKSGKGRRVDLDQDTVALLRSWKAQQAQDQLAMGGAWPAHGLVFTREDGAVFHPDTASTVFDRLVKVSGLPRITFHGLRHTHATILLANGVPVKVVSERLGHATVQITLDTYGHVIPGLQGQAVSVFATAMGGA